MIGVLTAVGHDRRLPLERRSLLLGRHHPVVPDLGGHDRRPGGAAILFSTVYVKLLILCSVRCEPAEK